ncbi:MULTISPECIES: helix-turn-helix transcriptional regulator [Niastella]|uniref:Helix-turn-helix transcriptional regulator n=1 Tax=Niastella soli TaxID=2821487 RepID=A0ABS3Z151_9BACT|nr:AraC family transcriptional regulator [Niastella soli]MBO9203126.1 helix-turn-helix transcriptional regulator [Niastella soli]
MQIKLIADNYKELSFTDQLPEMLTNYLIPGASSVSASGDFGHVLFQQLQTEGISIRLQHFLMNRGCTITMQEFEPLLKLRFHLINHLHYHIEGLGNLLFYEQGYNLLYFPFQNHRIHFQNAGVYFSIDIHYPVYVLSQKLPPLVLMNDFHKKVIQQQPAMLTPVNQVANRPLLTQVYQLMQAGKRPATSLHARSLTLLTSCLENISENPMWEPVSLSMDEAQAIYQARTKMEADLKKDWTLKELTLLTGLNDYKLKTGFQQLYQSSPADYLRDVRMEKAWQLLSGKKFSVSQVASAVGYTNLSAFSKAFKKYYNITARERSKEHVE